MRSEKLFIALSLVIGGSFLQPAEAQQTSIFSAVLPAGRAVQVGTLATAFATVINSGSVTATGCQIALPPGLAADFYYQATDSATNAPIPGYKNVPVDIGAGQAQSFLFALTPQAPFAAQDVRLRFNCANAPDAAVYSGLNTLLLSSSSTPGPDVVALAATVNGDGIVDVPGPTGTGFFAVATVNVGAAATISASANTGNSALPVGLSICQTNPATGSCLAPPSTSVTTTIDAGATPTFAVFATGSDYIAFHPAVNRIFVVFRDAGGAVKGATSVAVRTLGTPPANVAPVANAGAAQRVTTGSTVTLDGSGSSDANGDPLTYAWTVTSKPVGSTASLSGATTARPSFVTDLTGTYVASLVVNDGKVSSAPATVSVTAASETFDTLQGAWPDGITTGNTFSTDDGAPSVSTSPTTLTIRIDQFFDPTCVYTAPLTATRDAAGPGTYQCSDFTTGSWQLTAMRRNDKEDIYIEMLKDGARKKTYGMKPGGLTTARPLPAAITTLVGGYAGVGIGGPFGTQPSDPIIDVNGSTVTITLEEFFSGTCRYTASIGVDGKSIINGTYQCSDFTTGTWTLLDLRAIGGNDVHVSLLANGYLRRAYGMK